MLEGQEIVYSKLVLKSQHYKSAEKYSFYKPEIHNRGEDLIFLYPKSIYVLK